MESRRNHTSIILAKHLIIYGGINSRGTELNDVWTLNLLNLKWSELIIENHDTSKNGIAYHSCCSVFHPHRKFTSLNKYSEGNTCESTNFRVKIEGVYFFGGKNSLGECCN